MTKKIVAKRHLKFAVISTDIVLFRIIKGRLTLLLGKVQGNPFYPDNWAVIGGLIKPEETAEEAATRLMIDKGGIENFYKEQLYTFSAIDRDPRGRVVSVAYLGIIGEDAASIRESGIEIKWAPTDALPKLAYDHNIMAEIALERLRSRIEYTNIAQYFLPDNFTLSDLQKVYEIVLGKGIDKRNFRKKILAGRILKDTKLTRKEGVMRPAVLYTFASKEVKVVEAVK